MICDFCRVENLDSIYEVPGSLYGMRIFVCHQCGLVQSIKTKEKDSQVRIPSISCDADWGNIRHTKGQRVEASEGIMEKYLDWQHMRQVLDIGASRGGFIRWVSERAKNKVEMTAIEPDDRIADDYKDIKNAKLHLARFEDVELSDEVFDMVYCSHTLEHVDSASSAIQKMWRIMKTGGLCFLEVPNIDVLCDRESVEEFFIDKHIFHFSHVLLTEYLKQSGFEIVYSSVGEDPYNIAYILKKTSNVPQLQEFVPKEPGLSSCHRTLIEDYIAQLKSNREKLKKVAEKLHAFMERQKVVFWGASRVFDALVRYGELKTEKIFCLVDRYLWKILPEVHGKKVERPEALKLLAPDVVIILARSSDEQIFQEVQSFGVRRRIVKFRDLLNEA